MLTHQRIVEAVAKTAERFPIKKVSYFGSYAEGNATEESDLDLLVEFSQAISLLTQIGFQLEIEDELNIPVDVVSHPIPKTSYITIGKTVVVYPCQKHLTSPLAPFPLSMKIRDKNILLKLKDEAKALQKLIDGYDLQSFIGNDMLRRATGMTLINIGELVTRLSDEIKQQDSEVPWRAITQLRNVTAHGYDTLDMGRIWETVTVSVPPFLTQIEAMLDGG